MTREEWVKRCSSILNGTYNIKESLAYTLAIFARIGMSEDKVIEPDFIAPMIGENSQCHFDYLGNRINIKTFKRLLSLKGMVKENIGKKIMYCPNCIFELESDTYCKNKCPDCSTSLDYVTVDKQMTDAMVFHERLARALQAGIVDERL